MCKKRNYHVNKSIHFAWKDKRHKKLLVKFCFFQNEIFLLECHHSQMEDEFLRVFEALSKPLVIGKTYLYMRLWNWVRKEHPQFLVQEGT